MRKHRYLNTEQESVMSQQPQPIRQFDHVGIRVSDRQQAVEFYQRLGFQELRRFDREEANEMESPDGVRINLIFNGARLPDGRNPLLDEPIKRPGVTHAAFVVDDLYRLKAWLEMEGIPITQGIHPIGPRRITLFIRDPDRNVLEFNQLVGESEAEEHPRATTLAREQPMKDRLNSSHVAISYAVFCLKKKI